MELHEANFLVKAFLVGQKFSVVILFDNPPKRMHPEVHLVFRRRLQKVRPVVHLQPELVHPLLGSVGEVVREDSDSDLLDLAVVIDYVFALQIVGLVNPELVEMVVQHEVPLILGLQREHAHRVCVLF